MRRFEKLPTPQGIGAGQTATINLPLGPTYHRFYLMLNVDVEGEATDVAPADWGAHIEEFRLMVNGDTRITIAGEDLAKFAAYYGRPAEAGVMPVYLSQPWARTMPGEDNTAYGTASGIATFTLEVDFKSDIVINQFEVSAVQSAPQAFGPHLRIQRFSDSMAMTGVKEISDIPLGAYNMLGLHFTTDKIDNLRVLADNRQIIEDSKLTRNVHLRLAGRVPQAGMTHIDFMVDNRLSEALPMALNDFRIKATVTAASQSWYLYAVSIQGVASA